jgi:hypothetical protein
VPFFFSFTRVMYLNYLIWSTNAWPESWQDSSSENGTANHYKGQCFYRSVHDAMRRAVAAPA